MTKNKNIPSPRFGLLCLRAMGTGVGGIKHHRNNSESAIYLVSVSIFSRGHSLSMLIYHFSRAIQYIYIYVSFLRPALQVKHLLHPMYNSALSQSDWEINKRSISEKENFLLFEKRFNEILN